MLHRKLPQLGDATQEELLFDALMQPVRGMLSKPHPATLGPGQWALIQNFRRDRGVLRVRGGSDSISSQISDFGFRGAAQLRVNGANRLFCAWATDADEEDPEIAVYKRDDSDGSWDEISATAGKYGKTRFETDTGDYVRFTAVHDKFTNRDLVIIQSGAEDARIYDDGGSDVKMAIIRNIAVSSKSVQKVQALFGNGFKLQADVISFPNLGGMSGAYATGTAAPEHFIELTAAAGVAANDYVDINLNIQSYNYAATGDQALFLVDFHGYGQWLDNLEILMRDMNLPSDTTIWKGNDPKYTRYRVSFDAEGSKEIIAFPIGHIPTEKRAGVFAFRFKWIGGSGAPPAGGAKMSVYMINPSGWVPGGTQYGLTFFNRGSRSESGPAYSEVYETFRVQDMGGTALGGARLPFSPLLHYSYRLHYINVSQTEANLGTDAIRLYRKLPGESQFHLINQGGIATYSGGAWTVSGGAGALTETDDSGGIFLPGQNTYEFVITDSQHVNVPKGEAMLVANGRLFVGAKRGNVLQDLYVSEFQNPFRFRVARRNEPGSPTSIALDGEGIQQIVSSATSSIGGAQVFIFTNQNIYTCSGSDSLNLSRVTRIAQIGTNSPFSVAEHKGAIYFVDDEMQVRRLQAGLQDLSRTSVDDKLQTVPAARRRFLSGVFHGDRYYLAYSSEESESNDRCLVYFAQPTAESFEGSWESDDKLPSPLSGELLASWFDEGTQEKRLIAFASDGSVYEYDSARYDEDLGEPIEVQLNTRQIHFGMRKVFSVGHMGTTMQAAGGQTLTFVRNYPRYGSQLETTMSLTPAALETSGYAALVFRQDNFDDEQLTGDRPHDVACQILVTGSLPAGTEIYQLEAEIVPVDGEGRDAT